MLLFVYRKEHAAMELQRLVQDYAVWHEVSGHSPKTIRWYVWVLHTFARWLIATGRSTKVTEITLADVRAFLHAEMERDTLYPAHSTGVGCCYWISWIIPLSSLDRIHAHSRAHPALKLPHGSTTR